MLKVGYDVTPRDPKGEGGYEDVKNLKNIGDTTACMKRRAIVAKGCGQLTSNNTYVDDSLFSSIKTAEEIASTGVDYCGPVKTSHKVFFLDTLEKLMKYWLGG